MDTGTQVLVIDGHDWFVEALRLSLLDAADIQLDVATSKDEALSIFERTRCEVVVLDPSVCDGLDLARTMLEARPDLAIIVVTDEGDDLAVLDAVLLGVRGWVLRADGPGELLSALRAVSRGGSQLPADPVRQLLAARLAHPRPTASAIRELTSRERDVLLCLASGISRRQISEELRLSPNTVRTYVRSIFRKLHVHSTPDAVALAAAARAGDLHG